MTVMSFRLSKNLSKGVRRIRDAGRFSEGFKGMQSTHGEAVAWDVYEAAILQRFGAINEDPMAELKNLKYETTVKEYQSQFEKLMNQVDITESQAISMFIGGLPASIELKVRMFKPRSLTDAFSLAGLQEATIAALKQRNAPILTTPSGWNANRSVTYPSKSTTTTLALPAPNNQTVTKYPASSVSTPRKMLSQKEFAEKRAKSQCFYCDKKSVWKKKTEEESDYVCLDLSNQTPQSSPHISLNALSGIPTHNTKRSTLGTIQWNFKDLVMKFQYEGQKVVLRGTHKSELAWLSGRQMSKLVSQHGKAHISALCCVGQPATLNLMQCNSGQEMVLGAHLTQLLQEPYRYPPSQKDTIEAMVKKLLDSGVIRPSNSPFSSPIVMVKKKDGSWRMCIDYRHLNKHTVKDKFPIPVIEELIDELQGAQVFSKLDLRSEYHQIRMCESDVYKTAFKTHEGHYEFVVMPFGLTNAPSTFQALMNSVFKPFLRKFTLATNRRFIKGYASISQPLTMLLKKNAFQWNPKAEKAFEKLQQAMIQSPVLALPNFDEEFVIEIDASGIGHFKIRIDHFSLKYVLDQRLTTPFQSKWLPKLLGFDDEIEYKKGADNAAAELKDKEFFSVCWLDKTLVNSKYVWQNDQLRRKDKWVVGKDLELRKKLIDHFHGSAGCGWPLWSSGYHKKTYRLLLLEGFEENGQGMGLLQPLPIPDKIWQDLSMDFIESLPMSQGKSSLLVVVDRLSKYAHFLPLAHPYTASQVAQLFLDNVYKLHGLPKTITEIVNKCLESYLRCMTGEPPKDWVKWVPLAEYWYNTNYHSVLDTTPYEVVYGQTPPMHIPYVAKDSPVEAVDRTLQAREQVVQLLKFNLKKAQDRMKSQADKRRSNRSFQVNDWVYLKLQPYRQLTVRQGGHHKLSSKFFGPFQVVEKIRKVAYKLKLPNYAKVHPVFHVSQLKPCYIDSAVMGSFPVCDSEGLLAATPLKLLDRRMVKQNNRMVVFGLIQWSNGSAEDATWEKLEDLLARFPEFSLDP
ncbi:retrotransposable element Tf2 [Tanacetum coccineum]